MVKMGEFHIKDILPQYKNVLCELYNIGCVNLMTFVGKVAIDSCVAVMVFHRLFFSYKRKVIHALYVNYSI